MCFRFPVTLYRDSARQGRITFHSPLLRETSDYTCEPEGILAPDQARDLFRQIRQAPLSEEGMIGQFGWKV
jgi:hypothetical protein